MNERKELIKALTLAGHSAEKALEIAIDFERGNRHAIAWVKAATP